MDLVSFNRILTEKNYRFEVLKIGMRSEAVVVRKLQLTAKPLEVAEQIKEAVSPYVERVLDVFPLKWRYPREQEGNKEYNAYHGKFDGNYQVTLIPKDNLFIPGCIPVGSDKVLGEVRYPNGEVKNLLCSNCFEPGHLRGDAECTGGRSWMDYVAKFNKESEDHLKEDGKQFVAEITEEEKLRSALDEKNAEMRRMQHEEKNWRMKRRKMETMLCRRRSS